MGFSLSVSQADAVLRALKKDFRVYAPKRFPKQGRYSDTDIIRYAEVDTFADIVWDTKSDYPAKEVITPIQQAIFYFTEDEYRASKAKTKPILLLPAPATSTPKGFRPGSTPETAAMTTCTTPGSGSW